MQRLLPPAFALCLLLVAAAAHAQPAAVAPGAGDLQALLARLAQNTPDSERLLEERLSAFTMTSVAEELDGKGGVKHTKLRVTRVREEGGKRVAEIVRAMDDEKDVTAKKRAELDAKARDEDRKKNEKGLSFPVPFTAEGQPLHRFQLVGPHPTDPSKVVIRFEPAGRKGTDVMIGEGVVDPVTGMLHSLRFRPSKYPGSFVDRMEISMQFRTEPGVGAVVQRIVGQGDGGLLFVRKHRRTTVTFTDVVFKPGRASLTSP